MRKLLFSGLISVLTANSALAYTDKELGTAVGLAAAIKCSVENNYISEVEEMPQLEYYLEENNVSHLRE